MRSRQRGGRYRIRSKTYQILKMFYSREHGEHTGVILQFMYAVVPTRHADRAGGTPKLGHPHQSSSTMVPAVSSSVKWGGEWY